MGEFLSGQDVLDRFGVSLGELVQAIRDGLPAFDAISGARIVDQDDMVSKPKFQTEAEAANAVDRAALLVRSQGGRSPFVGSPVDQVVRQNYIWLFMNTCKAYDFPEGKPRPEGPYEVFPLRFETFQREYAEDVNVGAYGAGKTVHALYAESIGAFRFKGGDVEHRWGMAGNAMPSAPHDLRSIIEPWKSFLEGREDLQDIRIEMYLARIEKGLSLKQLGGMYPLRSNVGRDIRWAKKRCVEIRKQFPSLPELPG